MIIFLQFSFSDFIELDSIENQKKVVSNNLFYPITKHSFAKNLGSAILRKPFQYNPLTSDISSNFAFNFIKNMKVKSKNIKELGLINCLNHYRIENSYFNSTAIFEFVFKSKKRVNEGLHEKYFNEIENNLPVNTRFRKHHKYIYFHKKNKFLNYFSEQYLLDVIESLLNESIGYKFDNLWENIEIAKHSQILKKFHIRASIQNKFINYNNQEKYIYQIIPQIIISLEPNDFIVFNKLKKYKRFEGFYSFHQKFNNRIYHLIVSNYLEMEPKTTSLNSIREKRILISNLFIEKENLKNLLKAINNNLLNKEIITESSDSIQNGINKILKKLNSSKFNFGFEKNELEPSFLFEVNSLCEKIKNLEFRRQIEKNIINFIMNQTNISNSNIGVIGDNAKLDNISFVQNNYILENKLILEEELSKLLGNLKKKIQNNLETENAVNAVIHVENAISDIQNDKSTFAQNLAKGGKWLLGVAKEIGISLTVELLQKQLS